jgi:WD40 repeat protein
MRLGGAVRAWWCAGVMAAGLGIAAVPGLAPAAAPAPAAMLRVGGGQADSPPIKRVFFLPGDQAVVFLSAGAPQVWRTSAGGIDYSFKGVSAQSLSLSADGTKIAASGGALIGIWNVAMRASEAVLNVPRRGSLEVALSHDGAWAATAGIDKTLRIWDVAHNSAERDLPLNGIISALAFDPRQPWLAESDLSGGVRLFDAEKGLLLRAFEAPRDSTALAPPPAWSEALAFSPNGELLAGLDSGAGALLVWRVKDGRVLAKITPPPEGPGPRAAMHAVAFSPDGRRLAVGDDAGGLWLWAWQRARVAGHETVSTRALRSLSFAHSGAQIAAAGDDGVIRVWDVRALLANSAASGAEDKSAP